MREKKHRIGDGQSEYVELGRGQGFGYCYAKSFALLVATCSSKPNQIHDHGIGDQAENYDEQAREQVGVGPYSKPEVLIERSGGGNGLTFVTHV